MRILRTACLVTALVMAPLSAVGDASYSLASYRAMAVPAPSPSERLMAVYYASVARSDMLQRLRERFPTIVW